MNNWKQKLIDKYSYLFNEFNHPIEVQDGWAELVSQLVEKIDILCENFGSIINIEQIKSKYGSLRCYVHYLPDREDDFVYILDEIINASEWRSEHICELCGCLGKEDPTELQWIRIRCKRHQGLRSEEYEQLNTTR